MYYYIGAYDDSIQSLASIPITSKNAKEVLYMRAKCYTILKELNNALLDLDKVFELTGD